MLKHSWVRFLATAASAALTFGGLVSLSVATAAPAAAADPASTVPPVIQTPSNAVTTDALPTAQINGIAWDEAIVGNTVYAGGQFTAARPAGVAAGGAGEVTRYNLMSYNLTTGVMTNWAPNVNGRIRVVTASPDGSRIYIGGSFTQVNGVTRSRIAAFNTSDGSLVTSFAPVVNSDVFGIAATNSMVYIGGWFTAVNSTARGRLAAVSASTGALTSWAPVADTTVYALAVTAAADRVLVAGSFNTLNGVAATSLGSLSATDGTSYPFAVNQEIHNTGNSAAMMSLKIVDGKAYSSAFWYGGTGNFEGAVIFDPYDGTILNLANCLGDTYDMAPMNGLLYMVSHHHNCSSVGGFPEQPSRIWQHNDAVTIAPTGLTQDTLPYSTHPGFPSGSYVHWFPTMTVGNASGSSQAGWTLESSGDYLVEGGEFLAVNGTPQQGLVRFTTTANGSPNAMGGYAPKSSITPTVTNLSATSTRVRFQADYDRENATMSYRLVRKLTGHTLETTLYQTSGDSSFWDRPFYQFIDTTAVAGTSYQYKVYTTDSAGNVHESNFSAGNVAGANVPEATAYSNQVFADGATNYWRMDDPSGSTSITDWADAANNLTPTAGVTLGATGAILGSSDTAAAFSGADAVTAVSSQSLPGPNTFSEELWFNTTTTSGGKLLGFGDATTGTSGSYDRHIYMSNDGRLTFGVYNNGTYTITSAKQYNDGAWHHVVAELSSAGMAFYVDGLKIGSNAGTTVGQSYTGFWRVGGDNTGGWDNTGSSNYFNGTIDDVAIYPTALTRDQIRDHYTKSGRTVNVPGAPSDAYGLAVYNDSPVLYWRLGEASGTTASDSSGNAQDGTYNNGPILGVSSDVVSGNTAAGFTGSQFVASNASFNNPTVFSEEAWFNTTTNGGGKIIGFGNAQTGSSSGYDRHVYMNTSGQVVFGTWTGQETLASSTKSYNDGHWHHVVATMGSDGMKLYVDGVLVGTNANTVPQAYTGYWRVGGDTGWDGTGYFSGTIDEAAVYDQVLTAGQVRAHYRASTASTNALPTGSIGGSCTAAGVCTGLTANVSDPDGTIASYSWNFGDGTATASGATVDHTYTTTGTYTITLTATDDQGGASTFTKNVTVKALPPVPSDQYGSVVAADNPYLYWRLDDSGSVATDYSRYGNDGTYYGAVTQGQSSPVAGSDSAASFDTNGWVSSNNQFTNPTTFTAEAWFNTSYAGGRIIGFSDTKDNWSGNYDRHVYLNGSGQLVFGVWTGGGAQTITTSAAYTDSAWHQVVATMDSTNGMKLYVDGNLAGTNANTTIAAFNGYWKVGADNVWNADGNFHGTIDEAAVYDHVLSAADVLRHYRASTSFVNKAPTASFTTARTGLKVDFTGSGSDSDGTVQGYAWNFGDGKTSTDQSPSHTYASAGTYQVQLTVTDDLGATTTVTKSVTVRVASAPSDAYGTAVMSSDPLLYWRLADTSGTTALDQTARSNDGTYYGNVGLGASSPVAYGNKAADFSAANNWVASNDSFDNPTVFSEEAWFKTTGNATGGKIIGFGSKQDQGSDHFDRHVYLDDSGHLVFGVYDGNANTITTSGTYNDDAWHYVVATFGPSGRVLYVDGVAQASAGATTPENYVGYWRVGQDNGWATNNDFTGVIDEVAVYGKVLSASEVAAHYAASTVSNAAPTADFTSTCTGATCSFQATATDDGTVTGYDWQFGDGTSGSGANVSHTYASGTYHVTLTVTDNDNATTTVTHDVVVDTTNHAPVPVIGTPTLTGATVSVDGSGSTDPDGNQTIASYTWNFGDGSAAVTGTSATAQHTYSAGGDYTITLTVTDTDGASASTTAQVTVANLSPTASFTATPTNLSVAFDASASSDPEGKPLTYLWDFGDGSTDSTSGVTVTHVYATAGTRTVTLTVTDDKGATAASMQSVTVTAANQPPTASFTATPTDLSVAFDGSASSDPEGKPLTYAWNFGDGSTDTTSGVTATHVYATAGTRTVTLTVTDDKGATATSTQSVTVTAANQPPTASFTATPTDLSVAFDGSASSDPEGKPLTYAWNFGDGATDTTSGATVTHAYAAANTYTVTLTVTDDKGATGTSTKSVTVTAQTAQVLAKDGFSRTGTNTWGSAETGGAWTLTGPTSFSTDGSVGKVTMTATGVTRTALLNSVSAKDVTFTGDLALDKAPVGGTYYQQVFARVADSGTYYSLTARLETTGILRLILARMVSGTETQLKTLAISGFNYASGEKLKFRFDVHGTPATLEGKVWRATATEPTAAMITATDSTADLQVNGGLGLRFYTGSGMTSLPVVVSVDNLLATAYSTTPVTNQPPVAKFSASAKYLKVSVDASDSSDPDGTISSYAWDFGDGTGSGKTASHTYSTAGTYTIKLTVTDNSGASTSTTKDVTVAADQKPTASFTATVSDLKVDVDASGSTDPDGNSTITSYAWDYGDGTGTGKTDSHTYSSAGTYTVKLTVTDDGGETDSTTKSVTVTAPTVTTYAKDAFNRTASSGWGTADKGGAWTVNSTANFSTDGANGVVKVAAGATRQASLNSVSAKDVSLVTDFSLDQAPAGGNYYHQVLARVVGSSTYYSLTARAESTGIMRVYVARMVSGTETVLKTTVLSGFNYVAGEKIKVRFDVSGTGTTTLSGKVWRSSDSEPSAATVSTTDTTAELQAAGAVSIKFYAGSTMTSVPLTVKVDNFEVDAK